MNEYKVKIIGQGAVSGFGIGCDPLWQGLLHGKSAIGPIRDMVIFDQLPGFRAKIPDDVFAFPAPQFLNGYGKDPFIRMCGLVLEEMFSAFGGQVDGFGGDELSFFLSTLKGSITCFEEKMNSLESDKDMPGEILLNEPAGILASILKAGGTTRTYSIACASGTTAVAAGAADIRYGRSRTSIILGGDLFAYFNHTGFSCLKALSHHPCKPFDKDRDGLTLGEAFAGICLEKARGKEGIQIMGYGISNDANHITGPSKTGEGLSRAIADCLEDAGIRPDQVGAILAHGTATRYNDAMEVKAYRAIFGNSIPPVCGIKGAIGHTLGAAGAIETVVAMQIIENRKVPATIGNQSSNHLDISFGQQKLGSPVVLNCNSGFGGVNAAVLIGRPDELS